MSRRTRALIVGATLAAMHLAALTAVAHAQATDEPTGKQAARQPPTHSVGSLAGQIVVGVPSKPVRLKPVEALGAVVLSSAVTPSY